MMPPSCPMKKGTGSEQMREFSAILSGCEVPVPLFQQAVSRPMPAGHQLHLPSAGVSGWSSPSPALRGGWIPRSSFVDKLSPC